MYRPEAELHSELAYYPLRSGEDVSRFVDILAAPPERELRGESREAVLLYEHELSLGNYTNRLGEKRVVEGGLSLVEVKEMASLYKKHTHEVNLTYLMSDEAVGVRRSLGLADGYSKDEVTRAVYEIASVVGPGAMKELALASDKWSLAKVTNDFAEGAELTEMQRVTAFSGPEELLGTLASYRSYHAFLREVEADLKRESDGGDESAARMALAEIYHKVVNGELASLYPDVIALWRQAEALGDSDLQERIAEAWPSARSVASMSESRYREYIVGLDRIRNGTVLVEGRFTSVSPALRETLAQSSTTELESASARFTPEEREALSTIRLNAREMASYCEHVMSEFGLLSDEPESTFFDDPYRTHRAADGKWQVVVRVDKSTSAMGAESPAGIFEIPASFNRSLTKSDAPVGVIPGAAHEIMHLYQVDNSERGAGIALTRSLGGRSSLALREAGGVYTERRIQEELFGVRRPDSAHYMKAVDVIEAGGSENDAIRVFFESYSEQNPHESLEARVRDSVSRVKRIARRYGGFNSQPLNYAQTAMIADGISRLSDGQRARLLAEGAYDMGDMARLHEFGLLSQEPEEFPYDRYCDIAEEWLRQKLEDTKTEKE